MKAVVFHDVGDIRLDDVPDPGIEAPTDAVIRITTSAICGTDLHMVRGTFAGMKPGTILGHEAVGIVEELGPMVRNFEVGDRVVICSTIACGACSYCRAGCHSQCDNANPNGNRAGTSFFGGPEPTGPFNGLQAEKARIPYAHTTMVKVPDEVTDDQAILTSDIFPTGYFGADAADIEPGDTVAVFGAGPVGLFAIISARLLGAGRVIAVDEHDDRLAKARELGAETVNFSKEDPVETIVEMTNGIGVDRVIDAVGVDSQHAHGGPAKDEAEEKSGTFDAQVDRVAPEQNVQGDLWKPGDAPSQALEWSVRALAKAGTLSIIGVYPPTMQSFPIGEAMNKNLTMKMGNCPHRRYIPYLLDLIRSGTVDPVKVLSQVEPIGTAIEAFETFDKRAPGWIKVELEAAE
ncbi:zinc-dependent alcohol dehydrogenase [uncultured Jannaschia sp.]|uniref:zinc-dependent alcohol dehydrogenase n=1 Tax=uncultured Jannaschia sp. TaxID=293347 RepID=UPI00263624EC|nr:zinc-dependent alcohol dehydrogenase [uncultured Jannaschia sp.]